MVTVIGLTGNIACGKSTVGKIFLDLNIPVLDSDDVVHKLYAEDKKVQNELMQEFGTLDKKEIAQMVFGDSDTHVQKRKSLEAIIHPAVDNAFRNWVKENQKEVFMVNLVPLLFEAGLEFRYDYIACVTTDEKNQLERLRKRNPEMPEQEALARIKSQMPQEQKRQKSNFEIKNSGNIEDLKIQVEDILDELRAQIS